MAKVFQTPEYVKKVIDEIIDSPEIQKLFSEQAMDRAEHSEEPSDRESEERTFFRLWLIDQYVRYPKVYRSIENHFTAQGMVLPPEPADFMKWFVRFARQSRDYLSVKIEDRHFRLYHDERAETLSKMRSWDGLYQDLSDNGYVSTTPEVFNYVMEFKQLPGGKEKIQWRKSNADALAFQTTFGFSMPMLNMCFQSKTRKKFTEGSRSITARKEPLPTILEKYKVR
jgi:hypothetical protein